MTTGEKIKALREKKGLSQQELANMLKLTQQAVDKWEQDKTKPQANTLKKLVTILDTSADYLLDSDTETKTTPSSGADEYTVIIPLCASVRAGFNGGVECVELISEMAMDRRLINTGKGSKLVAFVCKGDSMKSDDDDTINDGDVVIMREQPDVENGEKAIVVIEGEFENMGVIKKVKKVPNGIILQSANPEYESKRFMGEDMKKIRILGKVINSIKSH